MKPAILEKGRKDSRPLCKSPLILPCLLLSAAAFDPTESIETAPTTQSAASAPASRPSREVDVRHLVKQLGAADYKAREWAQRRLQRLGEKAVPYLVEFIDDPNPEIADRVAALIKRPINPKVRVEAAVRLIATAEPDRIEIGAYMLFVAPSEDYPLFVERTKGAAEPFRTAFAEVAEQLDMLVRHENVVMETYNKHRLTKPEAAERIRMQYEELKLARAEAAYWCALAAFEEHDGRVTSRPSTMPAGGNRNASEPSSDD